MRVTLLSFTCVGGAFDTVVSSSLLVSSSASTLSTISIAFDTPCFFGVQSLLATLTVVVLAFTFQWDDDLLLGGRVNFDDGFLFDNFDGAFVLVLVALFDIFGGAFVVVLVARVDGRAAPSLGLCASEGTIEGDMSCGVVVLLIRSVAVARSVCEEQR